MISLSIAKDYTKGWNPKLTEAFFEDYKTEKGKIPYRIYIPYSSQETNSEKYGRRQFTGIPSNIKNFIKPLGYFVWNYDRGIAKKYRKKWNDVDRYVKIGKLLKKDPEMKKQFDNDPSRNMVKKIRTSKQLIVISRHPVDIVGASTGRSWSSCIRVINDERRNTIREEIRGGALIAYIISEKDKNIRRPSARIMMRPWTAQIKDKRNWLGAGEPYGTCQRHIFREKIKEFLTKVNPDSGIYRRFPGSYHDGGPSQQITDYNHLENDVFYIRNPILNFRDFTESVEWFQKTDFLKRTVKEMFRNHKIAFEVLKAYRRMIAEPRMQLACRMTRQQYRSNFWTITEDIIQNSTQEDIDFFFKYMETLSKSLKSGKGQGTGATKEHVTNLKGDLKKVMKDIQEQKNLETPAAIAA